jgi:hypothetical protein
MLFIHPMFSTRAQFNIDHTNKTAIANATSEVVSNASDLNDI